MELELSGKAFIITGGTEGLGLALAQSLVAEGAKVAICGRRAEKVAEAALLLGPNVLAVQADVTVTEQLDTFFDQALATFGRLDGVVNNAGRSAATPLPRSRHAASGWMMRERSSDTEPSQLPALPSQARRLTQPSWPCRVETMPRRAAVDGVRREVEAA